MYFLLVESYCDRIAVLATEKACTFAVRICIATKQDVSRDRRELISKGHPEVSCGVL